MRKVAAAMLAVPVLAIIYLPVLGRRSIATRLALAGSVVVIVAVAAFGLAQPVPTTATPPAPPIRALPAEAFRSVVTGLGLHAGIPIEFSEPMDPTSVAAALSVEPAAAVELQWSADHKRLTVVPSGHWPAGTYEVLTVQPGALAQSGRPMSSVVRAAFVTRSAILGRIVASGASGGSASVTTSFRLSFDGPVAAADVAAALKTSPVVHGTVSVVAGRPETTLREGSTLEFTPDAPLTPGTAYTISLAGLLDLDGAPVVGATKLAFTTTAAPSVVRFRPANGTAKVDRSAPLSVRFSTAMSHASTAAAFHVTANGAVVAGKISFGASSTVLVFTPARPMPNSATVVMTVDATATSTQGISLGAAATATIHTIAPPKPAPKRVTTRSIPRSTSSGSGSAVGGGSWGAVETYYLRLMNCTRTGGWVTSTGSCSSPGGRNVAPLKLDAGISSRVSRPYAKKLAVNNLCTHFSGGNPGDRLRAAGYTSYRWAENIGCLSGNPYWAVLSTHIYFQNEKSSNGGHYVNMMNAAYDRCGIGVWVASGRVRLVIDFYHP